MLNEMPVIGLAADNGHSLYSCGSMNFYFPLPYPLTASIKPAFFRLFRRLPAAVMEMLKISIISLRPKMPSNIICANRVVRSFLTHAQPPDLQSVKHDLLCFFQRIVYRR